MDIRVPLATCLVVLLASASQGQGTFRDTTIRVVNVTASYSFQMPSGELAQRYGNNSNVGLAVENKLRSNYLLGLEGSFLFGNQIREPGLLRNVRDANGVILDTEGEEAEVLLFQRGWSVFAVAGKVIPVAGPNPNSGLVVKMGAGYLRHRIRIETQQNTVPQLEGDYLEGYDRLAAGPAALFFLGYRHMGNNRLVNFMVGFEMMAAFTTPLRAFNFDTGRAETGTRYDGLTGLRFGWTLPIYRQVDDAFYFY